MYAQSFNRGIAPLIIIAIIALVVVVGGGAYLATHGGGDDAMMEDDGDSVNESTPAGEGTLRSLFMLGSNVRCTFSDASEGGQNSGTVYVADGGSSIRGDFLSTSSNGQVVESHMIKRGNMNNFWTSDLEQGYSMEVKEGEFFPESNSGDKSVDPDSRVDYECSPWRVDNSMFNLPSNIEFLEVGAMMQGGVNVDAGGSAGTQGSPPDFSEYCDLCNQAPAGVARQQCLQAYGCI